MEKSIKKLGRAGVITFALGSLLVGCGGTPPSSSGDNGTSKNASGSSGTSAPDVTLTIMGWNVAEQTIEKDSALYTKAHPNVHFKYVKESSPPDTYTKYNAELASGSGVPDIMIVESEPAPSFISKFPNRFLDLTSRISDLKSQFAPAKWTDLTSEDGKIYGIPWDIGPSLVFYRKDFFQQAGINADDIKTWDDYIAAGQKLDQHFNGKVKMTAGAYGDDGLFKMLLNEENASFFNNKGEITVNGPEAVKAVSVEKEMVDKGLVKQLPDATGWNDLIKAFSSNEIAAVPFGVWYVGTLSTSAPDQSGKWGAFELPAFSPGGNRAANLGGSNLMISAKTKNPDVAYDFAKFCMTNTEALDISMGFGIFPSYIPYFDSPIFQKGLDFFGGQNVFKLAADETKVIPPSIHTKDFTTAHNYMNTAIGEALLNKKSVKQALDDAAKQIANDTGRKIAGQ